MKLIDRLNNNDGILSLFNNFSEEYYTYHKSKWTNYFEKAKNNLIAEQKLQKGWKKKLISELIVDFENIVRASAKEINDIIIKYTTGEYERFSDDKTFRRKIEKAFDYKSFRSSSKASWFAEKFDIKACLYCNAQFALVIGKDGVKKKILFQLDHFYNKSKYPFLSLTIGNLIPSCASCNISKSKKDFTLSTHIHPYHSDASKLFDFYIDENSALDYLFDMRNNKKLSPKIKIYDKRFEDHNNVFRLERTYEKHTDIVEELILKSLYYNDSKKKELQQEFAELNLSSSLINRFILGNYSLDSEINKRPLSKLSKDIAKQLKLV